MSMEKDKRLCYCRWCSISCSFHSSGISAATISIIFIILLIALLPSASSTSSTSDELQNFGVSIGRNLLQAIKECPVDVQSWNYTIVTSKCKGPRYPPHLCCAALKELACPYSDEINDVTNNCATTMFSYINLYGNYPPGLFANTCRDSLRGLECTEAQKSKVSRTTTSSATTTTRTLSTRAFFFILTVLYWFFL